LFFFGRLTRRRRGIASNPAVASAWAGAIIDDDAPVLSNTRGTLAFAAVGFLLLCFCFDACFGLFAWLRRCSCHPGPHTHTHPHINDVRSDTGRGAGVRQSSSLSVFL
jgi:hypothetical protein